MDTEACLARARARGYLLGLDRLEFPTPAPCTRRLADK
jgi:hypothetical protein